MQLFIYLSIYGNDAVFANLNKENFIQFKKMQMWHIDSHFRHLSFMTLLESGVAQMLESIRAKELVASHPLRVSCPLQTVWPLCRLLESQLQSQKRSHENEAEALRGEIQSLKEENNRQQQLLAQNLQLPPEARIEASLQHEITRLTNENLVRRIAVSQSAVCSFWTSIAFPCWE